MPRPRDVTLTQLAYFVRTAELGSMTDAAAELFVAQSAISASIAALERALGTTLLVRRRGMALSLTAQGTTLLPRARSIISAIDDAMEEVGPGTLTGRLPVACFTTLVPFSIPRILAALAAEHPGLTLEVHDLSAAEVSRSLLERSAEIAITYDIGLDHAEIETEHLGEAHFYAAVSAAHPLAEHRSVTISQLAAFPMAILDIPVSRDRFLAPFDERGLSPRISFRSPSFEAVRAVVAHSNAFTLLNQRPAHDQTYSGGRLVSLPITDGPAPLPITLAWVRGSTSSRKAAAFAAACRKVFAWSNSHAD